MVPADWPELALRLGAALLCGFAIGINRDLHGKPTGVRLHGLVAIAAALFVFAGNDFSLSMQVSDSATHVIQGIVGGVGFLGAGVIFHQPATGKVQGLTTAAAVWATAALGVICGLGHWLVAVMGAGAALLAIGIGNLIDRRFGPGSE